MASIVVAAPPATGETRPLLQIAAGLVRRGHAVTMIAASRFGDQVAATGARSIALTGVADLDDRHLTETFPQLLTLAPGPDQWNFTFGFLADAIPTEHHQLQELFEADPDAVLVANSTYLGGWAMGLGAPGPRPRRYVTVGCNPLSLPSSDTTPTGPLPPGADGDAGAANREANVRFAAAMEPTRRRIEQVVRPLGATAAVPDFFEGIVTVPDAFAALTVPGLEFERSDAPPSLHLVGALPAPEPEPGWRPPAWWADLEAAGEAGRPVVVVTQGSLDNHDIGRLVRPALDALADDDVLVVAALGREVGALPGPVPANARVEEFLPFGRLLPRADVLVTNGGFGATQQALAAATPVVVAGDTDDKTLVAARVTARGAGVDLGTATPTPTQVRRAVLALLGDDAVRQRVQRLAAEYARHDPVAAVERLALAHAR